MSGVEVSVIVPIYNAATIIDGLLDALDVQTLDAARYEVVLVDDASTDGTPDLIIRKLTPGARARFHLVRQPVNGGPAAARNAGLAVASAPIIAFTDADCEPDPDWLETGLARLRADDAPAGVEGQTLPKGEPGPLTHQMVNTTGGLFMTCNMLYRRDALGEGFDPRFRVAFLEDSDVAFNVLERGEDIVWAPEVIVRHLVLPASRGKFMKEARKRFYNPLLAKKHPRAYAEHIRGVVPGIPRLHVRYMTALVATLVALATGFPGLALLLLAPSGLYLRRIWHAYRAKDPLTRLQAAAHPFVQTAFVLRGCVAFRRSPRGV